MPKISTPMINLGSRPANNAMHMRVNRMIRTVPKSGWIKIRKSEMPR